jgi:hypothetical protein
MPKSFSLQIAEESTGSQPMGPETSEDADKESKWLKFHDKAILSTQLAEESSGSHHPMEPVSEENNSSAAEESRCSEIS